MSKTSKVLAGITSTALMLGLSGCGSEDRPPVPQDTGCTDWEWDQDDGVWECEDYSSSYFGYYYHGGSFYESKSSLHKSKSYIHYKKSSGFGGGSKFFGG